MQKKDKEKGVRMRQGQQQEVSPRVIQRTSRGDDKHLCFLVVGIMMMFLLLSVLTPAHACDENSPVTAYIESIQQMNWQKMHSMLSADARYTDPTMTFFDRPGIDLTGPDAIVAF